MKLYLFHILIFINIIFCEAFDGLTLVTTMGNGQNGSTTTLIDNNENIINSWVHETGFQV